DAAVDERPRRLPGELVLEQPQVDMIEREGQRHPSPMHPRRDLERLAACGRRGVRVFEDGFGSHSAWVPPAIAGGRICLLLTNFLKLWRPTPPSRSTTAAP